MSRQSQSTGRGGGEAGRKGAARRRWVKDLVNVGVVVGLFGAVYLLPPDTSLAEMQKSGVMRVCVPSEFPPLVMSGEQGPGFDIDLLQQIANRLDVRLDINVNPIMGKDFNPRNWRVTRAQCQVLAGGVTGSTTTRSFLETLGTGVQTGWAMLTLGEPVLRSGQRVGVLPGPGLDRVALTGFLRAHDIQVSLVRSPQALAEGLEQGLYEAAIADSVTAGHLSRSRSDMTAAWMPDELARFSLGLGLWKGDLTLKREISGILADLEKEKVLDELAARYGILLIEESATVIQ